MTASNHARAERLFSRPAADAGLTIPWTGTTLNASTQKIIQALAKERRSAASPSPFYAEHTLDPRTFHIEIKGVGPVSMPLGRHGIERLLSVSSAAKFGLREKTLLDRKVRDTQEIPADKLRVRYDKKAMSSMLADMRDAMGLPKNAVLTPHLHNMLIYGPEQFFKKHRDSEKIDGMVATLVVVLPSPHIGGDLLIRHGKEQHRFASENLDGETLQCITFYADCHHEVDKIKQGYRVALTYNLALESTPSLSREKKRANPALEKALKEYFHREDGQDAEPPKLVYFLDHSYTEHSLKWDLLKGADRKNAEALRCAAEHRGLTPHLALAEIHESWTADDGYDDRYDEEYDPEPGELIDGSTVLSHWLDAAGKKLPYRELSVSEDELCWTKDTKESDLINSEHEGWMGNYGNTIDYWYRRAAIVLWRESDQVAMRFDLDYDRALAGLSALTKKRGNEARVADIVSKAGPYLRRAARDTGTGQFKPFIRIALYLRDENIARTLLSDFSLADIDMDSARDWVDLQNAYGAAWCLALMKAWREGDERLRFRRPAASVNIDDLTRHLLSQGGDAGVAAFLADYYIGRIVQSDAYLAHAAPVEQMSALDKRMDALKKVICAGIALRDDSMVRKIVEHVTSHSALYPAPDLGDMVLELEKRGAGASSPACEALRDYAAQNIHRELGKGLRTEGDWSIEAQPSCKCAYCRTTVDFLKSTTEAIKVWPIAQQHRDHIMNVFRGSGLPIRFEVRKEGSPHRLVITKSERLYETDKKRFERLKSLDERLHIAARSASIR